MSVASRLRLAKATENLIASHTGSRLVGDEWRHHGDMVTPGASFVEAKRDNRSVTTGNLAIEMADIMVDPTHQVGDYVALSGALKAAASPYRVVMVYRLGETDNFVVFDPCAVLDYIVRSTRSSECDKRLKWIETSADIKEPGKERATTHNIIVKDFKRFADDGSLPVTLCTSESLAAVVADLEGRLRPKASTEMVLFGWSWFARLLPCRSGQGMSAPYYSRVEVAA